MERRLPAAWPGASATLRLSLSLSLNLSLSLSLSLSLGPGPGPGPGLSLTPTLPTLTPKQAAEGARGLEREAHCNIVLSVVTLVLPPQGC